MYKATKKKNKSKPVQLEAPESALLHGNSSVHLDEQWSSIATMSQEVALNYQRLLLQINILDEEPGNSFAKTQRRRRFRACVCPLA